MLGWNRLNRIRCVLLGEISSVNFRSRFGKTSKNEAFRLFVLLDADLYDFESGGRLHGFWAVLVTGFCVQSTGDGLCMAILAP